MPKRGSDANTRIFFDELVSIAASRLKATGVIRLEDQRAVIPLGSKPTHRTSLLPFSKTAARGSQTSSCAQNPAEGPKSFGCVDGGFFSLFLSPTAR
jgi:hypothetical protein